MRATLKTHTHTCQGRVKHLKWLTAKPSVCSTGEMIVVVIIYYYLDIKVFDIFDRHTHLQSTYGCYFAAMLDCREENVFRLLSFGSSLRIAG